MPKVKANNNDEIPCMRCGNMFKKMTYNSKDISSFSFPQYKIQRYNDFNSQPREINLCVDCCDKLDRFLYIYIEGQDYYKDLKDLTDEGEQNNE